MSGYRGSKHHNWKNGRIIENGYVRLLIEDDKYLPMCIRGRRVLEHGYVVARSLGRCLTGDEIVHHLNGIRGDNRLENLAIVNRNTHGKNTLLLIAQERIRELETPQSIGGSK